MNQELYTLIKEAKKGNKKAFAELMAIYKGKAYRQAYAMIGNRMEAEDVVQEAFIKVYYSLSKLDSAYAFSSWLSRIVARLCYDHIKTRKKDIPIDSIEIMVADTDFSKKDTEVSIHDALQKLSYDFREVIVLKDLEGYSYEEISTILDIPIGTVRSRIFNARSSLKEKLIKQGWVE